VNHDASARGKCGEAAANCWVLFVKGDDAVTRTPLHAKDRPQD
jgi:hypothetical protein